MTDAAEDIPAARPALTASRWRTRRSAAVAGIVFAVLLIAGLIIVRSALSGASPTVLAADPGRRRLLQAGFNLVPFAGIAFLWFIGVIRDQIGAVEDRLFSTVFLGSGLLFVAMLFLGAVISTSLLQHVGTSATQTPSGAVLWDYGRDATRVLVSVYAMRMAAVFTLSVSTLAVRTAALPRWVAILGYVEACALLLVAADNQWIQLAFPVWVLVLSITILITPAGTEGAGPRPRA
ncbi:MAG: hypothetical protein ACJ74U_18010 [Jatrophihabitantaceae bacterium]